MNAPKYTQGQKVKVLDAHGNEVEATITGVNWIPFLGYSYTVEYTEVISKKVSEKDLKG